MNKKVLSTATKELNKAKAPAKPKDIITDPAGQWKFPGQNTRIPSNDITMEGVNYPVMGIPNIGMPMMMYPGQDYNFPNADYVDEYPQMQKGGPLLNKTVTCSNCGWSWKASEGGTDLLTCHKCGSKAEINKAQDGGYIEAELTPEEIEEYRKGGYIIEDISVPELSKAQDGKQVSKKTKRNPALDAYMKRDMSQAYPIKNIPSETVQATANQKPKISQNINTKKDILGDIQKEKEAFAIRQNKDQIKKGTAPREEQPISEKLKDIVFNPITAAGHWVRGQEVPDYLQESLDNGTYGYWSNGTWHSERNPLDAVTDFSPVGLLHDANDTYEGIKNKDINQAGLGLLGFIPGVSEARKAKKVVNAVNATSDVSKAIQFSGPIKHSYLDVPEVLNALKTRGAYWDNIGAKGEDLLHSDMVNYHGTYSGRPIVEVKMPDGSSEMFYKSSGWAGKKGNANNGTTEGMWQVYGGHASSPHSNNWFIKDKDYQNYYNSKTFGSMAENMDKVLMQKYGFKNIDELENAFNFQNRFGNVDSYIPKKQGGFIETDLTKNEIQDLINQGYVIEENKHLKFNN